jgi:HD-like signal output (HDOD) protein/signal transduction histidine kinase
MPHYDHDIRNRLLVARLPAMPQILVKLIELCQTDEAGMADLARLIATDPGMTTKCLGLANSSAYHRGPGLKVGLEQSLSALGTDMIKTLVISESVFQTFNNFSHSGSTDLRMFWKHSLGAAVTAREIAKTIGYAQIEEAYLAGLLHDVGRLALLSAAPQEYAYNFLAQDDDTLCAIEQRTLEITHPEAGAWLLERWRLDSFMADSVLYHHEPVARLEAAHPLIRIVRLAHMLAGDAPDEHELQAAAALCNLNREQVEAIAQGAMAQVEQTARFLGIDLAAAADAIVPSGAGPVAVTPQQEKLNEEVRNLALLSELSRSFARKQGDPELLDMISRSARILFNIDDALVLLWNHRANALVGMASGVHQQRMADFAVPLAGTGPIAQAAQRRELAFITRESGELSVQEEQLLRLFGTECLMCLPMSANDRCLGVLIAGVAPWQAQHLQGRARFLRSFAVQATVALQNALAARSNQQQLGSDALDASRRVIHEVNNPLAIIKNYLGVLSAKLSKDSAVSGEMAILHEEIDRVSNIINGMGSGTRAPQGPTDVNRVVRDVVQLFQGAQLPAGITIVARLPEAPSEIEGAADPVKQVLMNLIKNAIEAMPKGGQINVHNNGRVHRDGGVYIELCVRDNGPGIPDHVLTHLFTPVRSNKPGANRGIGLSIVQGLVTQLGGLIGCRSGASGTTFDILLPLPNTAGASAVIAQAAAADLPGVAPAQSAPVANGATHGAQ